MTWPGPVGGNWEGGTVVDGRRWTHVPWEGWRDDGPSLPEPDRLARGRVYRRSRLRRWLRRHRHGVVTLTALGVLGGYAAVVIVFFDRTLPTLRSAGALVAAAVVLVGVLLSVVLWSRRD